MAEVDATQGTVTWGFNRFRSDALVQLLDDLLILEGTGLPPDRCGQVKQALGKIVNAATQIPDGSWLRGSIWNELQEFETLYERWNEHKGPKAAAERKKTLKAMRERRQKIAKKVRVNQHILANDLDLRLIEDIYGALGDLAKASPETFKNVAAAVNRFSKGMAAAL